MLACKVYVHVFVPLLVRCLMFAYTLFTGCFACLHVHAAEQGRLGLAATLAALQFSALSS